MNAPIPETIPEPLKDCITFHGHLCPGLVYGYIAAAEAQKRLELTRSMDEEVVAVCENDSCAVDAIQVLVGTTAGKGNLFIRNYGKGVYTIMSRDRKKAVRFSRRARYEYTGDNTAEFEKLDLAISEGRASHQDEWRLRLLKALDLLSKPVEDVFDVSEAPFEEPPYAAVARSEACVQCGEMTMSTRMVPTGDGGLYCIPCAQAAGMAVS